MTDSILYVRDPKTAVLQPLKLVDNGDGTYSFSSVGTSARMFTSTASSSTTLTCAALADVAGEYVGQMVVPQSGAMAGEGRTITAYNGTNIITVSPAWAADPGAATAGIVPFAVIPGSGGVSWDEPLAGHITAGTTGKKLSDIPTTAMRGTDNAALEIDLGNAQADTLKSTNAKLGNPATDLATQIAAIPTAAPTATQDGVYFDEILGSAGTALPIGTATSPVTNLADALTIMTARKLKKLYLAGTGAHAITLTDGINIQIVGNAEYAVTINAGATVIIGSDLLCKSFTNTTGTPTINGNLTSMTTISTTTGTITVWGNAYAGTTTTMSGAAGTLTVYGDAKLMGDVTTSNATAAITIGGNAFFGHDYQGTAGTLNINGNCQVVNTINIVASPGVSIKGKLDVSGDITITGAGSANISVIGNCTVLGNVTRPAGTLGTFTFGNLEVGQNVDVEGNASFTAYGNVIVHYVGWYSTGGTVLIVGDLVVRRGGIAASIGSLTVYGNIYAKNEFDTTTGSITVYGNAYVANGFCSATTGTITVWGNLYVGTTTTVSGAAGALVVHGNAVLIGAVGATNGTASITIDGFADIRGAITATGTITYRGVQPEVAVNISAISASETNFLDLEVASTHYTVSDLVLKCADPGADTVNVKIYKLVNAVLTSVVTFAITTVNYTSYFSLMDMLGQSILVGDKLKITVQATAGAGYAVTGSYSSRKD